jgi:simple sugar transport system permease protein
MKSILNLQKRKQQLSSIIKDQDLLRLIITVVIVFVLMSMLRPSKFLSDKNYQSMGYQIAELGLYSLAMMIAMLAGGIDLSIMGISNMASILAGFILHNAILKEYTGVSLWTSIILAIAVAIVTGILCGIFNGFLIAQLGLKPMLATLGTMNLYTGIAIIITKGESISKFPKEYLYFGNNAFLGIPIPLLLLVFVTIICTVILYKTRYGFEVKLIGSNPKASRFTGIKCRSALFRTYILSGVICSVAGLEVLTRTGSAKADYGSSYVFQAILCCVLGATNPDGGYARISCLILALISLQFLSSGFSMMRLSGYFTDFAWGVLLLLVLALQYMLTKLRQKKRRQIK